MSTSKNFRNREKANMFRHKLLSMETWMTMVNNFTIFLAIIMSIICALVTLKEEKDNEITSFLVCSNYFPHTLNLKNVCYELFLMLFSTVIWGSTGLAMTKNAISHTSKFKSNKQILVIQRASTVIQYWLSVQLGFFMCSCIFLTCTLGLIQISHRLFLFPILTIFMSMFGALASLHYVIN